MQTASDSHMDLACPGCRTAWDPHHVRHEAPRAWARTRAEADRVAERGFCGPQDAARLDARSHGWDFPLESNSLLNFTGCPRCPSRPQAARIAHAAPREAPLRRP